MAETGTDRPRTVFITGGSRGIGLEFCRHYKRHGWRVIATCRDPENASELRALAADGATEIHALDVADGNQIAGIADGLADQPIDLLINNAGIYGERPQTFEGLSQADWLKVLATNAVAPVLLSRALLPSLQAAPGAKIVMITSRMGSIASNGGDGDNAIYRSSKAALNAASTCLAHELKPKKIAVLLFHPGWVQIDMGTDAAAIDTVTSVAGITRETERLTIQDTGTFVDYAGKRIPW
ncbi:MAG: SDR family oxidoreductase [Geminicoccaceae bacterium]